MELSFLTELYQQAERERIPLSGQFELTPVCNLKCHMCYVHKPEEDKSNAKKLLPASFWIEQAKKAKEAGMLVLSLTGGETLLYPELDMLMQELVSMGFLISFNTNGTLIDEKWTKWFVKNPPAKINISLYGASDDVYEKLCGVKNGFQKVTKAITLLKDAGLNVYLNGVIVPENVKELPQMHQYAARMGLELHTSSYLFLPRGCQGAEPGQFHRLSPRKAAEAACFNHMIMVGREKFKKSAAVSAYQLEKAKQQKEWVPSFHNCRAGRCSFAVNWQGRMQPCVMFSSIGESLLEVEFDKAWRSIQKQVEELEVPTQCMNCRKQSICPSCKAAIFQETGSFDRAPEYLCAYCEHLQNILKKEGSGIAISVSDCGDFHFSGCAD